MLVALADHALARLEQAARERGAQVILIAKACYHLAQARSLAASKLRIHGRHYGGVLVRNLAWHVRIWPGTVAGTRARTRARVGAALLLTRFLSARSVSTPLVRLATLAALLRRAKVDDMCLSAVQEEEVAFF